MLIGHLRSLGLCVATKEKSARKSASDRPSWSGLATEASITSSTIFSSRAK